MTLVVLGIVLLHAVPVFIVGVLTKSKLILLFAAIIAGVIGVATGNPAYTAADLIGVVIAYFLGISYINDHKPASSPPANPPPVKPTPPVANNSELHFLHVIALCVVGGWLLARDMSRQGGSAVGKPSFFDLLFDPGFIGMAAAPAFALCGAAVLGWIVGRLVKPLQSHASWVALALAEGLFFAFKTGAEIRDERATMRNESPTQDVAPPTVSTQKPNPISRKNDRSLLTAKPNLVSRLQTLASEVKGGAPKPFGDHLTLLNASVNGTSLSISMRINNYTASDTEVQIPLANFSRGIAQYYCGSEPYGQLLSQGATIVAQLYGKDGGSIASYPVTITSCEK